METTKRLGIWMDHAAAHVMEFTTDPIITTTIQSGFTHEVKEQSLSKSEKGMHNKEQQQHSDYYKKLAAVIKDYDDVLLFGPTDAKVELFKLVRGDQQLAKIKIEIVPADKMTDNQEHAFVRKHFSGR